MMRDLSISYYCHSLFNLVIPSKFSLVIPSKFSLVIPSKFSLVIPSKARNLLFPALPECNRSLCSE